MDKMREEFERLSGISKDDRSSDPKYGDYDHPDKSMAFDYFKSVWQAALKSQEDSEAVGKIISIDGDSFISMDDDILNTLPVGIMLYTAPQPAQVPNWISVEDRLPPEGTPVLAAVHGFDTPLILEIRWEYPTYEESYKAYRYWDDPNNDGQNFEDRVFAWTSLVELPNQCP